MYDEHPQHLQTYGASDYAVIDNGGDYTVHVVCGMDADDNLYVLDVWRKQTESNVWVEAFLDFVALHQPLCWADEHGQIVKSLGPFFDRRAIERRTYCNRQQFLSVRNKPTRRRAFQARCAMGKVYLPRSAPWLSDVMAELLSFPAGKHDDAVDALGVLGRLRDDMVGAIVPKAEEERHDDGGYGFRPVADLDGHFIGHDDESSWRII